MNDKDLKTKINYIKKNGVDIVNLIIEEDIVNKYNEIFEKNRKIGQKKRIDILIEKGKYDIKILEKGKEINCKYCNDLYKFDTKEKTHRNGFCCYDCYKNSGEMELRRKKTTLKNRNFNVNDLEKNEIEKLYSGLQSDIVKKGQKSRVKTINENGGFSKICKKGKNNRYINFLLKYNIVNESDMKNMSEIMIETLFKKYFNKITKHDTKIKNGIIKKHGNYEKYRESYKDIFLNYCKKHNIDLEKLSVENIQKFRSNMYHIFSMSKDRKIKWMKTHLLNLNIDVGLMSDEDIEKKYGEYISSRYNLINNIHNGYKTTEKGYYYYKNIDKKMFYRSSWEKIVYTLIDDLISIKKIINVSYPDRVVYIYNDKKRHYYPDIYIKLSDGREKIIEIKPVCKINDDINVCKFKYAREQFKNFIILTENDIFDDNIKNIILS